jgi:hypothetical protein
MSLWGLLFIGLMPVGQLALGTLGSLLGIHAALAIGGVIALGAGLYATLRLRVLREWRAPAHTHVDEVPTVVGLGAPSIAMGETTRMGRLR